MLMLSGGTVGFARMLESVVGHDRNVYSSDEQWIIIKVLINEDVKQSKQALQMTISVPFGSLLNVIIG